MVVFVSANETAWVQRCACTRRLKYRAARDCVVQCLQFGKSVFIFGFATENVSGNHVLVSGSLGGGCPTQLNASHILQWCRWCARHSVCVPAAIMAILAIIP